MPIKSSTPSADDEIFAIISLGIGAHTAVGVVTKVSLGNVTDRDRLHLRRPPMRAGVDRLVDLAIFMLKRLLVQCRLRHDRPCLS